MRVFKQSRGERRAALRRRALIGGAVGAFVAFAVFGSLQLLSAQEAGDNAAPDERGVEVLVEVPAAQTGMQPHDPARLIARQALDTASP